LTILKNERGNTFFFVSDDTFTLNTERVLEVCHQIIDRIKPLSAIFYILDIFPGTDLYKAYKPATSTPR
jgi:hypothetical protein